MARAKYIALVADIDAYFRMAASGILVGRLGCSEVIEAHSFDETKECLRQRSDISIAMLNLSTPGMGGVVGLRTLRECFSETKVAVTSASTSRRTILSTLESGVHGYVLKNSGIEELTAALRLILEGGIYVPPLLAELGASSDVSVRSPLTPRQKDVLELLVQGKPNKEIASALKLSEGTVKIHLAAIYRRFGTHNRAAVAIACAHPNPTHEFLQATRSIMAPQLAMAD